MSHARRRPVPFLGVVGRKIHFRSPRRRNLAHRFEHQFLAEAAENSNVVHVKPRTKEELGLLMDLAGMSPAEGVSRQNSESDHLLTDKQQLQRQFVQRFLSSYLHWMRWSDQRSTRLEANAQRNHLKEVHINRLLKSARHQLFPNSRVSVSALKDQELADALDNAVEMLNHRISTTARFHTAATMSGPGTQKRLRSTQAMSETKRQWPYVSRPMEQPPSNAISIVSAWKPSKAPSSLAIFGKRKRSNENLGMPHPVTKKYELSAPATLEEAVQLAAPPEKANPFEQTFRQCLHQKDAIKRQLLEADKTELKNQLLSSLKDFSLADPPRDSGRLDQSTFQQYIRKWNRSVKKPICAPPVPSQQLFTLFDQDNTKAGYFAAKDVTTDFDPEMLQEKAKEKENMYKNMAASNKLLLEDRMAKTNWVKTSLDATRLTDLQEWLSKTSSGGSNWNMRKDYINGPTHFGNGASAVLADCTSRVAAGSSQNMLCIAEIMAQAASQDQVTKKLVPKEICAVDIPSFYFTSAPGKDFVDETAVKTVIENFNPQMH